MTMKLGVTGGIGSGKTTVCKVFNTLGIAVYSADDEAKTVMENDAGVRRKVNSITGKEMYSKGSLDRAELARLIFNDENLLQKINNIVHPVIFDNFKRWVEIQSGDYVILEAAILFEGGAEILVDRIVTVIAPLEERIERVIRRNNLTRQQVLERVRNQFEDDERLKRSDYVINNSENEMIIPSIIQIHNEMLTLLKKN